MKNIRYKKTLLVFTSFLVFNTFVSGCGQNGNQSTSSTTTLLSSSASFKTSGEEISVTAGLEEIPPESLTATAQDLEVHFGDDGEAFLLHLYNNDTAVAIARYVGTADWRLPIYHYNASDDAMESDSMEYYDIPSRNEISGNPESITSAKAGEVYYSDPNRIMVFYTDAKISGEYTKVGEFEATEEFQSAVRDNPVLEGWGNKIVLISTGD